MPCRCKKGKTVRYLVHLGDEESKKSYVTKFAVKGGLPELVFSVKFMLGRNKLDVKFSNEEYKKLANTNFLRKRLRYHDGQSDEKSYIYIEKE